MANRITVLSSFFTLLTLFIQASSSLGQQEGAGVEQEQWTFEIVRETAKNRQEVVLNIKVHGLEESAQSHFRIPIYEKEIDQSVFKNTIIAFPFFENPDPWEYSADIVGYQKEQFTAIKEQFDKQVKDIIQSQLFSNEVELAAGDASPWEFTVEQIDEIAKQLVPLELATEILALDVLVPHQQRVILKDHFSALGWKSLDSVYGSVVLGLSDKQKDEIGTIISETEAARNETLHSLLQSKNEIQRRLWEVVLDELTEDQQERLTNFKESFANRLRNRTSQPPLERYKIDGVDMHVYSMKEIEEEVVVAEPCKLSCSVDGFKKTFRNVDLYDHSLQGVGLHILPVVDNQRYLLGVDLSAEEDDLINSLRDEFLGDIAKLIKTDFKSSDNNDLLVPADNVSKQLFEFTVSAQIKKSFRRFSGECYKVLDETQKKVLLENQLGFELFRKGISVFESSVFCDQLNIDDAQRSRIKELIEQALDRTAIVETSAKKKLAELDARVELEISKTVTQDQRVILDEIR
jgi:hypothetical protein